MSRRYTVSLDVAIPRQLLGDVEDKLPYCDPGIVSSRIDPGRLSQVEIEIATDADVDLIAAKVKRLIGGMTAGWREAPEKVRWHGPDVPPRPAVDPWPALLASGEVAPLGDGQVALHGKAKALADYFDRHVRGFARAMHAQPAQYPQMIPVATLDRCQYFSSFPHHVTFCSHLSPDVDILSAFAKPRPPGQPPPLERGLVTPTHVLNPAMCFHTYAVLADTRLDAMRRFTTVGRCFRFEGDAFATLERLWDFSMRELIFVGTKDEVRAAREETIDAVMGWVTELGLEAEIKTANDPFFMTNFVAKKYHQLLTDAKWELQLKMPHTGRSVAAASFNYHENFFGRSYGISTDQGLAHTACTAFGIERWVWAFLCQHGVDSTTWPAVVLEGIQGSCPD